MSEIISISPDLNLAPQILESYRAANALAEQAKSYVSDAVLKAVECGRLLNQQKAALARGGWLAWLDANVPEISDRTARRYMALATRTNDTDLTDIATLRQAYLATGIIPEAPEKEEETPNPNKPWVKFIRPLDAFRLWYNRRVEKGNIDTWPEDSRRILKNELRWFVNLYEKL